MRLLRFGVVKMGSTIPLPKKKPQRAFMGLVGRSVSDPTGPADKPAPPPSLSPDAERKRLERKKRAEARERARMLVHIPAEVLEAERQEREEKELEEKEYAERVRRATEREAKKKNRIPLMSDGQYMTDAPKGHGLLFTGKDIERVSSRSLIDHGGVEPWFGEGVARLVRPSGQPPSDDQKVGSGSIGKLRDDNTVRILKGCRTFRVCLGGEDEQRHILRLLIGDVVGGQLESEVFEVVPDSDRFRCKVCQFTTDYWSDARRHFETAAIDEVTEYQTARKKAEESEQNFYQALAAMPIVPEGLTAPEFPLPSIEHAKIYRKALAAERKRAKAVLKRAQELADASNR
jgi:hypothetical protein